MKSINVVFKKIEVTDYYPQLDQVKIRILLNDGADKGFERQLAIKDPIEHVNEWLNEIKLKLKASHQVSTLDDHPLAGALVLNFKQEPEVIHDKMTRFLAQAKERIHSGKMAKLSYYDLEKKIKGQALLLQ